MALPHACAPTPSRQRERLLTNRSMRAWLYVSKIETNCNVIAPYAHGPSSKWLFQWGQVKLKGDTRTRAHIQHVLDTIFNQVFNQGQADLVPGLVSGPYIQHNPLFPNGLEAMMGYITQAG